MIKPIETKTSGRPKDPLKRLAILQAAMRLFMEKGFQGTSMEAVAKSAGVSKLTVYSHFGDKEHLFKAVIEAKCQEFAPPETFHRGVDETPYQVLLKIARGFVALITHPDVLKMYRVIISEAANNPRMAELFYAAGPERVKTAFARLLQELQQHGVLHIKNPAWAGDHFFALLKGDLHHRLLLNLPVPLSTEALQAYTVDCVDTFWRAYQATPPAPTPSDSAAAA